jgi:hypothetical protein
MEVNCAEPSPLVRVPGLICQLLKQNQNEVKITVFMIDKIKNIDVCTSLVTQ